MKLASKLKEYRVLDDIFIEFGEFEYSESQPWLFENTASTSENSEIIRQPVSGRIQTGNFLLK
jgi:hypothetical protein